MIPRIISYVYLLQKACNTRMIDPSHSTHPVKLPVVYCVKILSSYSHKHFHQISSIQESIDLIIEFANTQRDRSYKHDFKCSSRNTRECRSSSGRALSRVNASGTRARARVPRIRWGRPAPTVRYPL